MDLITLQKFLNSIGSERYAEDFNRAAHKSLYHYTDLGGLQGIVSSHDLWLTNSRFSNDDREGIHGYEVAHDVLKSEMKENSADKPFLERVIKLLDPEKPEGVYICCFCQSDNVLSQWRAYGANGTGVSMEIEAKKFSWATGPDTPQKLGLMRLWNVYYEKPRQEQLIVEAIRFGRKQKGKLEERARKTADVIEFFIPTFKSEDFKEENEWRLIFTPGHECTVHPQFRVARQILVPYFSLRQLLDKTGQILGRRARGLDKLPITHILIGPSPRGLLNKESARMLLAAAGYRPEMVDVSQTSYRGA